MIVYLKLLIGCYWGKQMVACQHDYFLISLMKNLNIFNGVFFESVYKHQKANKLKVIFELCSQLNLGLIIVEFFDSQCQYSVSFFGQQIILVFQAVIFFFQETENNFRGSFCDQQALGKSAETALLDYDWHPLEIWVELKDFLLLDVLLWLVSVISLLFFKGIFPVGLLEEKHLNWISL